MNYTSIKLLYTSKEKRKGGREGERKGDRPVKLTSIINKSGKMSAPS